MTFYAWSNKNARYNTTLLSFSSGYKFTNQYPLSMYVTFVSRKVATTLYYLYYYIYTSFNRRTQCIFVVRLERLNSFNNNQKSCQSESNMFTISFHRSLFIMLHTTCINSHALFTINVLSSIRQRHAKEIVYFL